VGNLWVFPKLNSNAFSHPLNMNQCLDAKCVLLVPMTMLQIGAEMCKDIAIKAKEEMPSSIQTILLEIYLILNL
jgi:hypothetical protein